MRRVVWVLVPVLLLGLLGLAMFATRAPSPTTAFTLAPGDCFDLPTDAQVGDIATIDCAKPHDAEVFVAEAIAGAPASSGAVSASASAPASSPASSASESEPASEVASEVASAAIGLPGYPGDTAIAKWVSATCGAAAQQAYLGPEAAPGPDLVVGYFFPTPDAWARGERQVTCYLHRVGSKLTGPLRTAAESSSPS